MLGMPIVAGKSNDGHVLDYNWVAIKSINITCSSPIPRSAAMMSKSVIGSC